MKILNKYSPDDVIVLSFQPYAYEMIKNGVKKVEYRKRFRKEATLAFIYVSSPVKAIMGYMELGIPLEGTAKEMSEIAENHIKGNGKSVYDYFEKENKGYAISILNFKEIKPVGLDFLRDEFSFTAPQFYMKPFSKMGFLDFLLGKI